MCTKKKKKTVQAFVLKKNVRFFKKGNSLPVQGLGLHCGGQCSIPGQGAKIPHAMWLSQKKVRFYIHTHTHIWVLPRWWNGKESTCQCRRPETLVQSLRQEDPLEEGTPTHSSVLAWRMPWTEEPGGSATVHGVTKSRAQLTTHIHIYIYIYSHIHIHIVVYIDTYIYVLCMCIYKKSLNFFALNNTS